MSWFSHDRYIPGGVLVRLCEDSGSNPDTIDLFFPGVSFPLIFWVESSSGREMYLRYGITAFLKVVHKSSHGSGTTGSFGCREVH